MDKALNAVFALIAAMLIVGTIESTEYLPGPGYAAGISCAVSDTADDCGPDDFSDTCVGCVDDCLQPEGE